MLKKFLLAMIPMAFMVATVWAEEDVLKDVANLKASAITDAQISIDDPTAALDVDALANNAGTEKKTDAIEACFRRFGYGGYSNYCYNYGYSSYCYQPCYTYSYYCYQPYYVAYRPVYSYCTSYWGCW